MKSDIPNMGSPTDMDIRLNETHVSDRELKDKVTRAQKSIFRHGASINGLHVKDVLDDKSLVPTLVCCSIFRIHSHLS